MKKKVTQTVTPFKNTLILITFVIVSIVNVFSPAYSQAQSLETKYDIHFSKGQTLAKAIEELRTVTKIKFSYDPAVTGAFELNEQSFKQETLSKILLAILKGTGLTYKGQGATVVIYKEASPNASAGGGPGTLKGRIVEFETSQPLPGATVYLVELQKGMQSNADGYYKFSNVPAGKYTLKVSYISYKTESVQVEVKTDKEENYDVKMQGSNSLQEVVVSSVRKSRPPVAHTSERQVLEEVKQSSLVVSAISSEQISKSADRNAAEVVQRISGVTTVDDKFIIVRGLNQRYNLTYLNDNVAPSTELYSRAFALDLIPSRIIDRIMVYKSPSPENQGDATGGVVKIYTKDAKNVKHFDIEVQGGWREGTTFKNMLTYQGGKFDFLGFDDGTRKLPSIVPGYGSLQKTAISQQQYATAFSPYLYLSQMKAAPNTQLTANYYDSFKLFGKPLSSLTSFGYKLENQHADIYRQQGIDDGFAGMQVNDNITLENNNRQNAQLNLLQNFTFSLRDSSSIQFKNFLLQQGQSTAIEKIFYRRLFADERSTNNKDIVLSYNQRFLYAGNLSGRHYYKNGRHRIDWNGGLTISSQQLPDQRVIRLQGPVGNFATGDPELYWYARSRTGDAESVDNTNRIAQGMISRTWTNNKESVYNGSIDYLFQYKPWLSFKAGTYQQWKERHVFRRVYTVQEGDYTGNFSDYYTAPGGYGTYVDPALYTFRQQDLSRIWSPQYLRDDKSGLLVVDKTQGSDAYVATEQTNSGYAAFSFTPAHRKYEIYGGVRVEYDRQRVGAAIQPTDISTGINQPVLVDIKKLEVLPSLNISYRPGNSWVVRAAVGKTLNRPEFTEISPFSDLDLENNTALRGNPYLRPASAWNYDLRTEFYPRANRQGETISVGAFYKEINNPIERINTSNRILNTPASISFQNASKATIKGVEIEIRKNLDFVPIGFFKRLSVIANFSFIKSQAVKDSASIAAEQGDKPDTRVADYTVKRPLQGQAPYIINAGLYYDNAASGTKISAIYNVVGTRIYAAGQGYVPNSFINGSEYRGSLLELPRHLVDVSVSQRVVKSVQAKLAVQNLLNQSIMMAEDYNYTYKYEPETKVTGTDGKTVTEGDNISSRYKPGRYFILSVSYSF
ncbi:TonB-dependent receptor [Mucilaginibacter paludis]|uniref:TonB-dependent receptor n=1 Tax=Mucilaginibacter paludis DSM 18603 TaxID=714943 RepID=H1YHU6_9SPHI|nr:TonB-dependent receptor [Mucilaginibacter paludis]EHQ27496.1 TonB-dependent receptor [Mucilaginibacter paludis DSM 18603]